MLGKKEFDSKLFEENDQKAKDAFQQFLDKIGVLATVENPQGRYGVDLLIILGDGTEFYADVEVRGNWSEGEFPFGTVHLPGRKEKFLDLDKPTVFVSFRKDLKAGIIFNINRKEFIKKPNKYVIGVEKFFAVPLEKCIKFGEYYA